MSGIKPVHQNIYPTADSLDAVLSDAVNDLPILHKNQLVTILMTYHNTFLAELDQARLSND